MGLKRSDTEMNSAYRRDDESLDLGFGCMHINTAMSGPGRCRDSMRENQQQYGDQN